MFLYSVSVSARMGKGHMSIVSIHKNKIIFTALLSTFIVGAILFSNLPFAQAIFPIPPISASPSGQGSFSSWSVSPVASSKVTAVTTSADSKFVFSSTLAQRITYKFNPTIPSGVKINSVTVEGILYKSLAGSPLDTCVKVIADQGTFNVKSGTPDCTMLTTGTTISKIYTTNPFNNKGWSASDFSKTNFGFEQATSGKTANLDKIQIIVNVQDITPPVVKVPKNIHVRATVHTFGSETAPATFTPAPSATDNIDGALPTTCTPLSGSTFNIGHTTVTCTAIDAAGNTGSSKFSVEVEDLLFDSLPTKSYALEDSGIITLRDVDAGNDLDDELHTKRITVTSKTDALIPVIHGSINLVLPEISLNSGTFVSNAITFTTGSTNAATSMLHALDGDLIVVNHDNEITATGHITPVGVSPLGTASGGVAPRATDTVRFYESDVYAIGQGATLKVNDASVPLATTSVLVRVKTTTCSPTAGDGTGFDVTLNRDGPTLTSFTAGALVNFIPTGSSVPGTNSLLAPVGCTVVGVYGAAPNAVAMIINDNNAVLGTYVPTNTVRSTCLGDTDADFDAICDSWENQATHSGSLSMPAGWYKVTGVADTGNAYTLTCNSAATYVTDPTGGTVCPSTTRKDLYVEIDYMTGHMPSSAAINSVVAAFGTAPVSAAPGGPKTGATAGIALHVIVDERVPHTASIAYNTGSLPTFISTKQQYFGTAAERALPVDITKLLEAKRQFFHYVLFTHTDTTSPLSSGYGDKPGNDIVVSLGNFIQHVGSTDQQAGTFMHELGHNLGLDHGGDNSVNCKPNYLSVMNYLLQFDGASGGYVTGRSLDFSRAKYSDIIQTGLREDITSILTGPSGKGTVIGGFNATFPIASGGLPPLVVTTGSRIDWNHDGTLSTSVTPTSQNVNYFNIADCNANTGTGTLTSYADWGGALVFNFRPSSGMDNGFTTANQFHDDSIAFGTPDAETLKPIIDPVADVTVPEGPFTTGNTVTIHDPDSLSWNVVVNYGDGTPDQSFFWDLGPGGEDNTISLVDTPVGLLPPLPHVYTDGPSGPHTVTVTITSNRGGVQSTSFDVTVTNVAPTVNAGVDQTVNEGATVSLGPATFTDPGTADTHTAKIDWGDGSLPDVGIVTEPIYGVGASPGTVSGSHVYADNGLYHVTVTVIDDDDVLGSGTGSDTFDVTVNNVAPVVDAGIPQEINEGETLSLDPATFTDPGTADTHTAKIDWGDGSLPDVGIVTEPIYGVGASPGTVSGSHVYDTSGPYTVTVTVKDDDDVAGSGTGFDTFAVTVNSIFERMFGGVAKGSPTDHGALVSINQGDGTQTVVGYAANSLFPAVGLSGLAYDGASSTLFGSTVGGGGTTSKLVEINPITGALGETSQPDIAEEGLSDFFPMSIGDLAINPLTGDLWGLRSNADGLGRQGELYTIDKITGVATIVPLNNSHFKSGGIAFSPDGTFYIIGSYCNGGCVNAVAVLHFDDGVYVFTSHAVPRFFDGLGIRSDGTLFATEGACDCSAPGIYIINPDTGGETFIGSSDTRFISDLAFEISTF